MKLTLDDMRLTSDERVEADIGGTWGQIKMSLCTSQVRKAAWVIYDALWERCLFDVEGDCEVSNILLDLEGTLTETLGPRLEDTDAAQLTYEHLPKGARP